MSKILLWKKFGRISKVMKGVIKSAARGKSEKMMELTSNKLIKHTDIKQSASVVIASRKDIWCIGWSHRHSFQIRKINRI